MIAVCMTFAAAGSRAAFVRRVVDDMDSEYLSLIWQIQPMPVFLWRPFRHSSPVF